MDNNEKNEMLVYILSLISDIERKQSFLIGFKFIDLDKIGEFRNDENIKKFIKDTIEKKLYKPNLTISQKLSRIDDISFRLFESCFEDYTKENHIKIYICYERLRREYWNIYMSTKDSESDERSDNLAAS